MDILLSEPVQALVIINVILTLSLLFPFVAGVWSLGLPGFMCLGAYTASVLTVEAGWAIAPALLAGSAAATVGSVPFGLLALRTHGIYLAIATLAAAELIVLFFSHFERVGGVTGYLGMPYLEVPWMWAVTLAVILLSGWLYNARFGKAMIAVGSDPLVASCNGLSVPVVQLAALAIGAALAGLAGGLYAHYYSFISPGNFTFARTISILLFLVAGGLTPAGAILGAAFLSLVPQYIKGLEAWSPAVYGAIVILIMALLPDGVLPKNRFARILRRLRVSRRSDGEFAAKMPIPEKTEDQV